MREIMQLIKRLGQDEEGAALVEYTVLLGIMLVAVITTIGKVGSIVWILVNRSSPSWPDVVSRV